MVIVPVYMACLCVAQKFKGSCRQEVLLSCRIIIAVTIKAKHSTAGLWNCIPCSET